MLRYLGFRTACDAAFGVFMVSWFVTRHGLFGAVLVSVYKAPAHIPFDWQPEREYWFTKQVWSVFVALLGSLQVCDSCVCVPKQKLIVHRRFFKYSGVHCSSASHIK
jgi:hypothetical protein